TRGLLLLACALLLALFFYCSRDHLVLPPFPTRRSSDLEALATQVVNGISSRIEGLPQVVRDVLSDPDAAAKLLSAGGEVVTQLLDRKSTRLNSSHVKISYAVFCLKKKSKTAVRYEGDNR